jgi:hypothetical protein
MKLYAGIAPDAKRQAQQRANPTLESAYGPDIARKGGRQVVQLSDNLSEWQLTGEPFVNPWNRCSPSSDLRLIGLVPPRAKGHWAWHRPCKFKVAAE